MSLFHPILFGYSLMVFCLSPHDALFAGVSSHAVQAVFGWRQMWSIKECYYKPSCDLHVDDLTEDALFAGVSSHAVQDVFGWRQMWSIKECYHKPSCDLHVDDLTEIRKEQKCYHLLFDSICKAAPVVAKSAATTSSVVLDHGGAANDVEDGQMGQITHSPLNCFFHHFHCHHDHHLRRTTPVTTPAHNSHQHRRPPSFATTITIFYVTTTTTLKGTSPSNSPTPSHHLRRPPEDPQPQPRNTIMSLVARNPGGDTGGNDQPLGGHHMEDAEARAGVNVDNSCITTRSPKERHRP
uniref:Uncharacterized protein n=1 Tax=Tanacetum cinerariifolium TaxID=118510 RepID=A0A6L2L441_TANCI|nr:hypothetical protein [Tanacetum cinerariifolium]